MRLPKARGLLGFVLIPLALIAGAVAWAERSGWLSMCRS